MAKDDAILEALVAALANSDGFPVPSMEELAARVLEQLRAREWDVRPAITIGFQPATAERHPGETWVPWLWQPAGDVYWHNSANTPPNNTPGWVLLYVRTKDGEVQQ